MFWIWFGCTVSLTFERIYGLNETETVAAAVLTQTLAAEKDVKQCGREHRADTHIRCRAKIQQKTTIGSTVDG